MTIRHYTNTATEATLTSGITAVDTTFSLTSFADYPAAEFTAAISRGEVDEEIVLVTVVSGSTVTVTRGYDGTTAKSHDAGATFLHVVVAKDYDEANTHVNATAGVHGAAGNVVGTSDVQTLTNKTLTSPTIAAAVMTGTTSMASVTLSGTLQVAGAVALSGLLTASAGLSVPVGQATDVDALTAATADVSGDATVGGTLAVTGAASAASVTGTTTVKGTPLESGSELVLAQLAADPAGVASKAKVWAKTDGGLYTRQGAATAAVRVPVFWGSGTVLPSAGVLTDDTFLHTGLDCVMRYIGTGWRQDYPPTVADAAARDAISTNYAAALYAGFEVWQTDAGLKQMWDGDSWALSTLTYFDAGAGGGAVGTTLTAPTDAASLTLPAGTYDVDYRMAFALSLSAPRQFTVSVVNGATTLASSSFSVETVGQAPSRDHASFDRITLTGSATVALRASASATGGTQTIGVNALRAVRVG